MVENTTWVWLDQLIFLLSQLVTISLRTQHVETSHGSGRVQVFIGLIRRRMK